MELEGIAFAAVPFGELVISTGGDAFAELCLREAFDALAVICRVAGLAVVRGVLRGVVCDFATL